MGIAYAFRSLFKSPGFTSLAILTMAVAIGANTALFSVFDTFVLHPIALPSAGRLVRIWTNNKERNVVAPVLSVPKYRLFAEQQTAFSGITASSFTTHVLTREGADPEQLTGLDVTQSFIPTLGLALARGRNFTAEEDVRNGPHVCILTYDMWKTRFGKRDGIVGRTIELDGVPTTVVGVLAEGMPAPLAPVQVLQPWPFNPPFLSDQQIQGGAGFLQATARLKPGATLAQAEAEVRSISHRYQEEYAGGLDANNENELRTWIEEQVGPVRPTLLILLAAVGLVLLIACANVSNLFLSRLATRHKETAVRLSLGATRRVLVGQFLLEALIFCGIAAALGVALALWLLRGAERVLTVQLAAPTHLALSAITLVFVAGLLALSTFAIGLVPALHASKLDLADVMKDSMRGTVGGRRGTRFRSVLIVAEVSLSILLLVGSGLLLVSFEKLQSTPAGFTTKGIAAAFVSPAAPRYATPAAAIGFYYQVLEALRANPQVRAATVTQGLPMAGFAPRRVYAVGGRPVPPVNQRPIAYSFAASEDYFKVLGIPVTKGRVFEATDIDSAPRVCVINASFAKRLFPGEDPIGQVIAFGQDASIRMQIVGVVGDVHSVGLNTPPPDAVYIPIRQALGGPQFIVASTTGDPATLQAAIKSAVASVDRTLAVSAFATLEQTVEQSLGVQKITAWLTGAFAVVALLLSALGLYSVLAYATSLRTGEIAIRMALGAGRSEVIRLVLTQGMRLVAAGLVIGLGVAAAGGKVLTALLYEVKPLDPGVFAVVTALFTAVAALACLVPSWRASRVEALVALRME